MFVQFFFSLSHPILKYLTRKPIKPCIFQTEARQKAEEEERERREAERKLAQEKELKEKRVKFIEI
jgi:hypothetical protein